jgi:hypothetical protein
VIDLAFMATLRLVSTTETVESVISSCTANVNVPARNIEFDPAGRSLPTLAVRPQGY